jgi:hypothetical protein
MITYPLNDITWLFKLALEFYQANPGEQISEFNWNQYASKVDKYEGWIVKAGDMSIHGYVVNIIPFLAALALGRSDQDLLDVIKQHQVTPYDFNNFKIETAKEGAPFVDFGEHFKRGFTQWDVCRSLVRAVSLEDEAAEDYLNNVDGVRHTHELNVACLLSAREDFWPATELTRMVANVAEERRMTPIPTSLEAFMSEDLDLNAFSDDQILTLLDRSGNLVDGMEAEIHLQNQFFSNLLTSNIQSKNENLKRILSVINSPKNPEMADPLERHILSELTGLRYDRGVTQGVILFNAIIQSLDPVTFPKIFDSTLLKVIATSVFDLTMVMATSPEEVPDTLKNVLIESNQLLSTLVPELEALEPDEYRSQHFKALKRLSSDSFAPQKLDGIDLNQLVHMIIRGFDAYKATIHVDGMGILSSSCKDEAEKDIGLFLRMVLPEMEIDYERFTGLSNDTRVLLATNGFDFKKLPNMTRHDRGQILSSQLGL